MLEFMQKMLWNMRNFSSYINRTWLPCCAFRFAAEITYYSRYYRPTHAMCGWVDGLSWLHNSDSA